MKNLIEKISEIPAISLFSTFSLSVLLVVLVLFPAASQHNEDAYSSKEIEEILVYFEAEGIDLLEKSKKYNFSESVIYFESVSYTKIRESQHLEKEDFEKRILDNVFSNIRSKASRLIRPIIHLSEKYQVDPYWIMAMVWTESHFNHEAKSHVGAAGLMQVMPKTRRYLKRKLHKKGIELESEKSWSEIQEIANGFNKKEEKQIRKILSNLELGIYYIKNLQNRFKDSHYATVAYNMGPTWVSRSISSGEEVASESNKYLAKIKRYYGILTGTAQSSLFLVSQHNYSPYQY
ncbi:MAG: lytic transglycosylase domain-containing protein [Halobacteriovoraceae bacterium]|nr:lytic transglycosylase domain-containing protein [Halobacteriovoraceae bacterium]MCB9093892.1 lytic transglycosylase domain-containing protein [Halobacteriovoraceae bacterium]